MQIISARYCNDLCYFNHSGKCVCFNYESKKRHKTKVLSFIKGNHEESIINKYLEPLGLKIEQYAKSKKYLHYKIIDL